MRLLNVPPPPRSTAHWLLPMLVAAALALGLVLLSTVGLEEWFALLGVGCVVCLLPVLPLLLHRRRP